MPCTICPTCGHRKTVKTPKPKHDHVDLSSLSRDELYAHYKRTAPVEDVRFWLRARMSEPIRDEFNLLMVEAMSGPVRDYKTRFTNLRDRWRQERAGDRWPSKAAWNRLAVFQRSRQARLKIEEIARPKAQKLNLMRATELEDDPIGDTDVQAVA